MYIFTIGNWFNSPQLHSIFSHCIDVSSINLFLHSILTEGSSWNFVNSANYKISKIPFHKFSELFREGTIRDWLIKSNLKLINCDMIITSFDFLAKTLHQARNSGFVPDIWLVSKLARFWSFLHYNLILLIFYTVCLKTKGVYISFRKMNFVL